MFKRKKPKDMSDASSLEGAPVTAISNKAIMRRYLDEGGVQVERNRYFVVILSLCVSIVVLAGAIYSLFPLKTVVPYDIKVDSIGRAEPIPITPEKFKAGDAEIKYHLAQWIDQIMTVRPGISRMNATKAYNYVDGDAVQQFAEWMNSYRPIDKAAANPDVTTDTYVTSLNKLGDDNYLVQFYTLTMDKGSQKKQYWTATINYSTYVPSTEEEILKNPIGLHIDSFSISKVIGGNQ